MLELLCISYMDLVWGSAYRKSRTVGRGWEQGLDLGEMNEMPWWKIWGGAHTLRHWSCICMPLRVSASLNVVPWLLHSPHRSPSPGQEDKDKQSGKQNLSMNPVKSSDHADASLKSPWETWGSGKPDPVSGSGVHCLIPMVTCLEVNFSVFFNETSFPSFNCVSWHFPINYIIVLRYHLCNT